MAVKKKYTKKVTDAIKEAVLLEASSPQGMSAAEDWGWRSLTQQASRDLSPLVQKRMQEIAFYLYDTDPIAKRIIELTRDFAFKVTSFTS